MLKGTRFGIGCLLIFTFMAPFQALSQPKCANGIPRAILCSNATL